MRMLLALAAMCFAPAFGGSDVGRADEIMRWAAKLGRYQYVKPPAITFASLAELQEMYCAPRGIVPADCRTIRGTFSDTEQRAYVLDTLPAVEQDATLFHELLHYLQHSQAPFMTRCAREIEAIRLTWEFESIVQGRSSPEPRISSFYGC